MHYDEDAEDAETLALGAENANRQTVKHYLTHPKGGALSPEQAEALLDKYTEEVQKGERFRSYANYVGGKILRGEGLPDGLGEDDVTPKGAGTRSENHG